MERDEAARLLVCAFAVSVHMRAVVHVWRAQTYIKIVRAAASCKREIIQTETCHLEKKKKNKPKTEQKKHGAEGHREMEPLQRIRWRRIRSCFQRQPYMSLYVWCMREWVHSQTRRTLWEHRNGRDASSNQGQTVLSLFPPFQHQSLRTHFLCETLMGFRQWEGLPVLHKKIKSLIKSSAIITCLWSDLCSVDFQASLNVSSSVNLFCQDLASVWHAKIQRGLRSLLHNSNAYQSKEKHLDSQELIILHCESLHQNSTYV